MKVTSKKVSRADFTAPLLSHNTHRHAVLCTSLTHTAHTLVLYCLLSFDCKVTTHCSITGNTHTHSPTIATQVGFTFDPTTARCHKLAHVMILACCCHLCVPSHSHRFLCVCLHVCTATARWSCCHCVLHEWSNLSRCEILLRTLSYLPSTCPPSNQP